MSAAAGVYVLAVAAATDRPGVPADGALPAPGGLPADAVGIGERGGQGDAEARPGRRQRDGPRLVHVGDGHGYGAGDLDAAARGLHSHLVVVALVGVGGRLVVGRNREARHAVVDGEAQCPAVDGECAAVWPRQGPADARPVRREGGAVGGHPPGVVLLVRRGLRPFDVERAAVGQRRRGGQYDGKQRHDERPQDARKRRAAPRTPHVSGQHLLRAERGPPTRSRPRNQRSPPRSLSQGLCAHHCLDQPTS